jgi:hypothetical protein
VMKENANDRSMCLCASDLSEFNPIPTVLRIFPVYMHINFTESIITILGGNINVARSCDCRKSRTSWVALSRISSLMPLGGISIPSTSLFIFWILCWRKSFRRERKVMNMDWVSTRIIVGFIL